MERSMAESVSLRGSNKVETYDFDGIGNQILNSFELGQVIYKSIVSPWTEAAEVRRRLLVSFSNRAGIYRCT